MTLPRRPVLYVMMLAVIGAAGCRSSGEPLPLMLRGTFVLRTVNGGPLPADISIQPNYQVILLADTLRFDSRRLARRARTERLQSSTLAPTVAHTTADFAVRIVGETIYLDFLCPFGAFCTTNGPEVGRLVDANTLMFGGSQPYVYVRP